MRGHLSSCRREAIAPFKFKWRHIPLVVIKKQVLPSKGALDDLRPADDLRTLLEKKV